MFISQILLQTEISRFPTAGRIFEFLDLSLQMTYSLPIAIWHFLCGEECIQTGENLTSRVKQK